MKAKPFERPAVPSLVGMGPSDMLSRAQLVALVASRVKRKRGDDDVIVRNRISSKVGYDVAQGKLHRQASGQFRLGDIGVWARAGWPDAAFRDIPMFAIQGGASLTTPVLRGEATGYTQPATLAAAAEEVLILRAENRALAYDRTVQGEKIRDLDAQVHRLRPGYEKRKRKPGR